MKAQLKRMFALLLVTLMITNSQSTACASLASYALGAKGVYASEVPEEVSTDAVGRAEEGDDSALKEDENTSLDGENQSSEDQEDQAVPDQDEQQSEEQDDQAVPDQDEQQSEEQDDQYEDSSEKEEVEEDAASGDEEEDQIDEDGESSGEDLEEDQEKDASDADVSEGSQEAEEAQSEAPSAQEAAAAEEAAVLADSVLVTAVLEDSQTPISEEYTNVSIPVENDVLDLEKSPIEEEITCAAQVAGTNRLYVETFTYGFATVGESEITSLNRADITEGTCIFLHYFSIDSRNL